MTRTVPDEAEYLVRNGRGEWEICHAGVFKTGDGPTYELAWADREGAHWCSNDDAIEVKDLPE